MRQIICVILLLLCLGACKTVEHQGPLYGAGATNAAGDIVVGTDKDKIE